ncbi:MAG TPA: DUF503 domain-containing protein [Chloroflexia bacterium]|jgi:uncharacterized protein YlxP (DUF503 family)|nr:DUF503 domain-containing protein [Chloroflexia bacterium]
MVIGTMRVVLFLPENGTIKDKRHVVKSILARVQNQFKVAAAEVEENDNLQAAVLGVACVSNSAPHANEILQHTINFIERNVLEGGLEDYEIEVMHVF